MFLREIYANRWVKLVLLAAGAAMGLYLVARLQSVLAALMIALILAYLCDPLADLFERLRLSRTGAVALVAALVLAALALLVLVVIPLFARELADLARGLPAAFDRLRAEQLPRLHGFLARFGITIPQTIEGSIEAARRHSDVLQRVSGKIWQPLVRAAASTFTGVVSTVIGLLNVVIIPVAWFYLLRDFDRIKARAAELVPVRHRATVSDYARRVDEVIRSFLQGQIIVALILGLIYGLGLQFVARVPLGFMLGALAGLLSIVPYLGLVVGIVPALLLALLAHGDWLHPLLVVVVFVVAQALEGNLITPKVVGEKVGLHPVTIIFSLLVFGELFGLLGLLIAVPLTAVLRVFLDEALARYAASAFFRAEG